MKRLCSNSSSIPEIQSDQKKIARADFYLCGFFRDDSEVSSVAKLWAWLCTPVHAGQQQSVSILSLYIDAPCFKCVQHTSYH